MKSMLWGWLSSATDTLAKIFVTGGAMHITSGTRTPLGVEQMTSLSSATALPSIPANAREAYIQAEGQTLRWRDDGTDPTASIGPRILADDTLPYVGDLSAVKIIEEVAGAKANVYYY